MLRVHDFCSVAVILGCSVIALVCDVAFTSSDFIVCRKVSAANNAADANQTECCFAPGCFSPV